MSFKDHVEILSEEQAIKWVDDLINTVETYRYRVDSQSASANPILISEQKSNYNKLLMHYGIAFGALQALAHTRNISENGFNKMKERVLQTMVPSVIGNFNYKQ